MKKSLLALAVLGAFAGAASAQSSVTIYGIVDVGFNSTDVGGTDGRTTGIESGNQSASRIGFKGVEDLGNGMSALFQLEGTIAADTGAFGGGFNRIAIVGLQSNAFGTVTLGRQTSALKDAYDQIDPFGDGGTIGAISSIFFNGSNIDPVNTAADVDALGYNGRVSNSVKYVTPSFGGFKATANYGFGQQAGSTSADSQWSAGAGYANGPLNVQAGYSRISGDNTVVTPLEAKLAFVGATYNFGAFKLHAAYADNKADYTGLGSLDSRNGLIGVSVPMGAGTLLASYAINDVRDLDDADSKKAAIMYTYDLSKRTNLYAGYSHTKNDDAVNLAGGTAGANNSVAAVGIRHKF